MEEFFASIDLEALKGVIVSLTVAFVGSSTFFYVVFMFFKKTFQLLKDKLAKQEELGNISQENYAKALEVLNTSQKLVIDELVNLRQANGSLEAQLQLLMDRIEVQEQMFAQLLDEELKNTNE